MLPLITIVYDSEIVLNFSRTNMIQDCFLTVCQLISAQVSFKRFNKGCRMGYLEVILTLLFPMVLYDPQVFRASNITVDMDLVRQVEAKYPAFLFKQQLTAFVEGLYGMIRDNVKRDISSVLTLIIQVTPSITSHPQVKNYFVF